MFIDLKKYLVCVIVVCYIQKFVQNYKNNAHTQHARAVFYAEYLF